VKDQFEVWNWVFPERGPHPCVIISHPDLAARARHVNILFCTSQQQSRKPKPEEVVLDTVDGLDWETFVNCSAMWLVESSTLFQRRGMVSHERRLAIRAKLRNLFRLMQTD